MGLATYDDLKQSIINWSHRDDVDLLMDDFIVLVEIEMFNNQVENLEVKGQETTDDSLMTTSRIIPLPSNYQVSRSVRINTVDIGLINYGLVTVEATESESYGLVTEEVTEVVNYGLVTQAAEDAIISSQEIGFRAPEQMIRLNSVGRPRYFTVVGNNMEFDRVPDSIYGIELKYYGTPLPLNDANQTNTVLTNNPNIYLFGALWAVFTFAVDEVQAQKYYAQFISAIRGANKLSKAGRYGPAPAMRIEGATP